jgi:ferredoxin-NADP reductase
VFVAGGIGITPYHSMLRYFADTGAPYRATLVYSNRDRESAPFLDELGDYEGTLPNFRLVLTMTDDSGWDGETRYIDAEMLRDHLGELDSYTFLVTGPPPMVESVAEKLTGAGVPEEQVLPERFSGY